MQFACASTLQCVWILVNLVYIGLNLYKGLALTAILYAIFAALSVAALVNWRRLLLRTPAGLRPVPGPVPPL